MRHPGAAPNPKSPTRAGTKPKVRAKERSPMKVLAIDVGGTHVKLLASTATEPRRFESGPKLAPAAMVAQCRSIADGWEFEAVTIGYPGPVRDGRIAGDPAHLDKGWVGFDFAAAFDCPVRILNDAAMQALGSYQGGRLLFLGLGTGLGTTLIVDGMIVAMELGHLPYRKSTFEDYVSDAALQARGRKKWRAHTADVVEALIRALLPEDVVIGGGNAKHLVPLPPACRMGDNANAFVGGFRAWSSEPWT